MDIHKLKYRIEASGWKLVSLGNECIKTKDEIAARKVLVRICGEISHQTLIFSEQNAQIDRNQRGFLISKDKPKLTWNRICQQVGEKRFESTPRTYFGRLLKSSQPEKTSKRWLVNGSDT